MSNYLQNRTEKETAIIAINTTTSNALHVIGKSLVALIIPAAITGTIISFQSSYDGVIFNDAYNSSGNKLEVTVAANRHIHLTPADFYGAKFVKLVSNQTELAARSIDVILMGV